MGRIARMLGRRDRTPVEPEPAPVVTGFHHRPTGWGDDEDEPDGERDRRGHGMNYLVTDQFGPNGGPTLG